MLIRDGRGRKSIDSGTSGDGLGVMGLIVAAYQDDISYRCSFCHLVLPFFDISSAEEKAVRT